jgi:hypothetical protein
LFNFKTAPLATVVPLAALPSALFVFTCNVPALIVVLPVKVFEPLRVSVPLSFLTRAPVPLITPLSAILPAPPKVAVKPPFTIPALKVKVPASEYIVVAEASVMAPPKVLLPLKFRKAPKLETP